MGDAVAMELSLKQYLMATSVWDSCDGWVGNCSFSKSGTNYLVNLRPQKSQSLKALVEIWAAVGLYLT